VAATALEAVLARFPNVRKLGREYAVHCPAHEDSSPSLNITQGTKGVVLTCRAGCDANDVLAALGLGWADLFDKPNEQPHKREILATYDYTDEVGDLLYQTVRYSPKGFAQRRPKPDGGWEWTLNGTRRVLYNLPAVLAESMVWVTEGEKDCETFRALGLTATTNVGGAGKWNAEYSEALRGRDVCIVADDDEAGHRHANTVAAALRDVAASVSTFKPAKGKDFTDHVQTFGLGLEHLKPLNEPPPKLVRSAAEILAAPPPPTPCLLEPALIVAGGITVIAAPTKVGKTWLWLHLVWALTEGRNLFGQFAAPNPVPVLMIQLELSEPAMHDRIQMLVNDLGWSAGGLERFHVACDRALMLDRRGGPERIVELIQACDPKPAVVVLDSYNAAVGGDPDKTAESRKAIHMLHEIQKATGVAWAITSEVRKAPPGQRLRYTMDDLKGSNELAYDADAVVMLKPAAEDRRRLGVHFVGMRHLAGEAPEDLVLVRDGGRFSLAHSDPVEEDVLKVVRDWVVSGGAQGVRACRQSVREAGIRVRDGVIDAARNRLISDEPELFPRLRSQGENN
jgi:5S rRNA maturation endonuclease (ribonuclease M5)